MGAHLKMRLKRPEDDRWGESERMFLAVNTLFCRMSSSKNFQGACAKQRGESQETNEPLLSVSSGECWLGPANAVEARRRGCSAHGCRDRSPTCSLRLVLLWPQSLL